MNQPTSQDDGRHQAVVYSSSDQFVDWAVPFLDRGLSAGEQVLAVAGHDNAELLRERLGMANGSLQYMELDRVYTTPARTMAALDGYAHEHEARGRGVRILGEPAWLDRSPFEQRSWHRYESLLNIAFEGRDVTVGCPYDGRSLDDATVGMIRRTHPLIEFGEADRRDAEFRDTAAFLADYAAHPLDRPADNAVALEFTTGGLAGVRRFVGDQAADLGVVDQPLRDLVVAVNEIATNAITHGGGRGRLTMWPVADFVAIEVRDRGVEPPDHLAGHLAPDIMNETEGGFGLWMARQLCDLVELRGDPGWVVRMYARRI
jgi:anti-sigma regulatory factor (Ser/Thr protein kinase)